MLEFVLYMLTFLIKVLPQKVYIHYLHFRSRRGPFCTGIYNLVVITNLLPLYNRMGQMLSQAQQNQIRIIPIYTITLIDIKLITLLPPSNKLHKFMLSFSGNIASTQKNLQLLPVTVFLDFLLYKEM